MPPLAIHRGLVATGDRLTRASIHCVTGRIVAFDDGSDMGGAEFDASGLSVLPGFIDIHTHGGGGHSFFTKDPGRLAQFGAWAAHHGVTAYLSSTIGRDADETCAFLQRLARYEHQAALPRWLGVHLEGPFLNPVRRGAFPAEQLRPPNPGEFERYVNASGGTVRQVTIAPELPGALETIEAIVAAGAVAAMGHTDAGFAEATAAFERGVSHVTHLFNAMRPFHHREAGPAVAALMAEGVTCELIADTVHVGPDAMRFAYRLLGPGRAVIVTDNLYLAGAQQQRGDFAGGEVSAGGDVARRADDTIVGSILPMDGHFRNAVHVLGLDLVAAARLCATNPAAVIGETERGRIAAGAFADLVLLDDALEVVATMCEGEVAYLRESDRWRLTPG